MWRKPKLLEQTASEEERVSEEDREQRDHELWKQKGELGSEGEGALLKHTLLK